MYILAVLNLVAYFQHKTFVVDFQGSVDRHWLSARRAAKAAAAQAPVASRPAFSHPPR